MKQNNAQKAEYSDLGASNENPNTTGDKKKKALQEALKQVRSEASVFNWELTRVHKGIIARKDHRILVLKIVVPSLVNGKERTFSSYKQVPMSIVKDKEKFDQTCALGFKSMSRQLEQKGIKVPQFDRTLSQ